VSRFYFERASLAASIVTVALTLAGCAGPAPAQATHPAPRIRTPQGQAAPPATPSAYVPPGTVESPSARWVLVMRFSTVDDLRGHKQAIYRVSTTSPYAVMSWARFERVRNSGGMPDLFAFGIDGPAGKTMMQTVDFGSLMSGVIYLPTPGDYTFYPHSQDRYAVEIYEPSPGNVIPSVSAPSPLLSDADNQEIEENSRLASLERSRSQHADGNDWADQQAQEADQRQRRQKSNEELQRHAFGGGG